jgi:hypothetical protein
MRLSWLDNVLWAASIVGNLALFIVLLTRKRWHSYPIFTALIGYYFLEGILLLFVSHYFAPHYAQIYWFSFCIDISLQIALIVEIARNVLRPTGTWVRDARMSFIIFGLLGAIIALGLSYAINPHVPKSIGAWGQRTFLFTSLLFCELFLAIMFSSRNLGLEWRNHVMGLGQGLTAWALISAGVDAAHSYLSETYISDFRGLEHVRSLAYVGAVVYWIAIFWVNEPERRPLSPEMQKYLVALHSKVQYDATQVSGTPNSR